MFDKWNRGADTVESVLISVERLASRLRGIETNRRTLVDANTAQIEALAARNQDYTTEISNAQALRKVLDGTAPVRQP